MNYEEAKYGQEDTYKAGKDDCLTEAEENEALDAEKEWFYFEELNQIEEANAIVQNIEDYPELITANGAVVEYKEVVVEYRTTHSEELLNKIATLEKTIIDLSKKLSQQLEQIPISEKKLITVKEFDNVYSISVEQQRILRGRFNDPLPHVQIKDRGNILYNPKEVEKWLENYKK